MAALLQATRDHMRTELHLDDTNCEVMFDGKPLPTAGEFFWSVHQRSWVGQHGDADLDELYGLTVTLSMRLNGQVPWDRAGVALLLKRPGGVYRRVEEARVKLHKNYVLMNLANALIDDPANKFVEPYMLAMIDLPRPQMASWFHGKRGRDSGISMAIQLSPAKRLQTLESMT